MADDPKIVNMNDLEWKDATYSEHYTGWSKRLTPSMERKQGHIGVVVERLKPKSLSCPFHYHVHEDEFCLILSGRAMLRYGDTTVEVKEGDAISFPRGERVAHQFYGVADFSYEIERGRRAERASPSQFHGRIKQCQFYNHTGWTTFPIGSALASGLMGRSALSIC